MSLLILEGVKKHFGAQEVLSGADLRIDPGEKIGLVGRNGGGKSTLLRLIERVEAPDWGRVTVRKGCDLGFVAQRAEFAAGETVRQHVEGGLASVRRVVEDLEAVAERMSDAQGEELDRLLAEHTHLTERVEELGGWEIERRAETVLSGIGLAPELWDREARTLSGGEKSRTALARALAPGHDLLLLDEPTNHLDLEGIEWMEDYIRSLPGAVLIVSHDRRLLENAVGAIYELERGRLTRFTGNYSRYVAQKAEKYESERRAWEQQQDQIRKEQAFIKKHMGSQRTSEAKGRQKKLRNVERLQEPHLDVRKPVVRPPKAARGGELVFETEGLAAGYGERVLFKGVDLRVGRGERVGIVGRNGTGKTTLLKILAGRLAPRAGEVKAGHGAVCGYFDQESGEMRPDGTPYSEIRRAKPEFTDLEIRSHLALFLFRGDEEIDKPIGALSGGERARLALAKLVLEQPSWLALDEPTNHLDLASRTALEEMLSEFGGAMLCISHDRAFLDDLCGRIVEVTPEGVRDFRGNYSEWREARLAEAAAAQAKEAARAAARKDDQRRQRERQAQADAKASARSGGKDGRNKGPKVRNPYKFKQLEERIMKLEERLAALNAELAEEAVWSDHSALRDKQFEIAELERELGEANAEWETWV